MTYPEYSRLHLPTIDTEILDFWNTAHVFERAISEREGAEPFVFFEGPPSANGLPGIHHVLSRAIKDAFCRFKTMQGYQVKRKGGWDTHGLPIELAVEKELGITKEDIGKKISVEEYNAACRSTVMRYKDLWDALTRKMGYWVDLDNPYITFDSQYIESVWHLLGILYKKDLLYKGYTIQPYSPAAGTGLSTHELNLPGCYREVTDTTVTAMFKVVPSDRTAFLFDTATDEDVRILAWTTTPWTLLSNTALTVGAKIDYVKVRTTNPYTKAAVSVVLAADLVGKWFGGKNQSEALHISEPFKGSALEGVRYEQLLPFGNPIEPLDPFTPAVDAFRVIVGDFVTTTDGTGVVHTAPSFGADDRRVARTAGIGALTLVDKQGRFVDSVGEYSGRYVKDYRNEPNYENPDVDIAVQLKMAGKAFNVQKYVHSYPHCWRTNKPVLYYPLDSWFVRTTAYKERMFELNQTIQWKPAATGEGRFGGWLKNLQDWNLSRSRFWGIPLPIWRTEIKEGEGATPPEELIVTSVAELAAHIERANAVLGLTQPVPDDLHRPYIDDVILVAPSGAPMRREADLIDVWFDSGSMPYAQHGFPNQTPNLLEGKWQADFIAEGVDQTRGWFFTLHAIAVMCFDSVAYRTVISNGLVLDDNGEKMSKSKGNIVDPFSTIEQWGADVTRWYMISASQVWDDLKFDIKVGLEETRNKFFGTLYNTYAFYALYANVDKFTFAEALIPTAERPEIDRWIISRLNTLVQEVEADMNAYELTNAARRIEAFVDDHLSNWYVRLCRRRFWKGDYAHDKISAYQTLYTCLATLSKLTAPIAPFFAEWLYRNLNTATRLEPHDSVHLTRFPVVDEASIDPALEERMDYAQRIASLVLSLRKREKIRVRQPLGRVLLPILNDRFMTQIEAVRELILAEVNVKTFEYITDTAGVVEKSVKPNFKTLGKKVGKLMKPLSDALATWTEADIAAFEQSGTAVLHLEGQHLTLEREDVEILSKDIPGWLVASDGALTIALDVTLTDDLRLEGIAREMVNRIQGLRKAQGFAVTDRILVHLEPNSLAQTTIAAFGTYICTETLADRISFDAHDAQGEMFDLNDEVTVRIGVTMSK